MIKLSNLKNSPLAKDSFWALAGNALGKGLSLFAGIAVARFLGSDVYGEYGMIKSTLLMIAIFSTFGLGYTATKYIAETKASASGKVRSVHQIAQTITLITSGIIALFVTIFAEQIATWLDSPDLGSLLRMSSIAIVANALNTTQVGELSGFRAFKTIARNNTLAGVVTFLLSVPGAYFGGIVGAIMALVLSLAFNCVVNYCSIKKMLPLGQRIKIKPDEVREIIRFSFPIALQESLYSITSWLGMAIIIKFAGYDQLGIYSAASQWMAVMLFIPGALRNVALSHFAENSVDLAKTQTITKRLLLVNVLSTMIPFLVIAACSSIIASFYGSSFDRLPAVLNICVFTAVISSMNNVLIQELIALNHNWFLFWSRFIRDVSILGLYMMIIPGSSYGARDVALISLIAQIVYLALLLAKNKIIVKRYGRNTVE
ncbi:MAG: oligosaccharide flippase family protein [Muribaculaceae bacterium]|nr:oligosaccharide flippase family protein [Muribaculaceae bacterium]